ncbi:hypothetical protein F4774DRAFT_423151 [Daldinia eschscholtzii]|nr:hypothetical protein F4774DRAFT_423151 [Daldinia eschscholtzii]
MKFATLDIRVTRVGYLFISSQARISMQPSSPRIESAWRTIHAPTYVDNAKSLTSVMVGLNEPPRTVTRLRDRSPVAEDREPLLGHPNERGSPFPEENYATVPLGERVCVVGLPIIVFLRLFNAVLAAFAIYKANKEVSEGWNIWIYRLLFDFCWILLVWNISALATGIINCLFLSIFNRKSGESVNNLVDKLRMQFACNDAILGLITLVLLVIACEGTGSRWEGQFTVLTAPTVVIVSTAEFITAIVQLLRFSETMLFSIKHASRRR